MLASSSCPAVSRQRYSCTGVLRLQPFNQARLPRTVVTNSQIYSSGDLPQQSKEAWTFLSEFTLKEFKGLAQPLVSSPEKRQRIREAIMEVYKSSRPDLGWVPSPDAEVLLGVLASDIKIAARAYRDWCEALNVPYVKPDSKVDGSPTAAGIKGPVYLKYNSKTRVSYVSTYTGRDRGVLIQLGQQQLGHFPLGLFDESMSRPAPEL